VLRWCRTFRNWRIDSAVDFRVGNILSEADDRRMKIDPKESFVRWQSATRKHFTVTSSVVLGLATGLLAFVSEHFLLDAPPPNWYVLLTGLIAVLSLGTSIGLALWCSINRLRDFRATAQIARKRAEGEAVLVADRRETTALGEFSWQLYTWQLILFGIGAVASVAALLGRALS